MNQIFLVVIFVSPFVGNIPSIDRVVVDVVEVGELSIVVASVVLNKPVAGMTKGYLHSLVIIA